MYTKRFAGLLLAAACLVGPVSAAEKTGAEVRTRIQKLEQAWNAGRVQEVLALFGDDARLVGEGEKHAVTGRAAIDAQVKALMDGSKQVRIDVVNIGQMGNDAAYSWVLWHVTPKEAGAQPFDVRSLYIWTRGKDGLRIRGDAYSMGVY